MPWMLPGSRSTVITVTPVVKWPRALRNSMTRVAGLASWKFLKIPYRVREKRSGGVEWGVARRRFEFAALFETR